MTEEQMKGSPDGLFSLLLLGNKSPETWWLETIIILFFLEISVGQGACEGLGGWLSFRPSCVCVHTVAIVAVAGDRAAGAHKSLFSYIVSASACATSVGLFEFPYTPL